MTAASRPLRIAAIVVPLAAIVVALFLALATEHREIARIGDDAVTVDCGLRGGGGQEAWGEAATWARETVQASHLLRAGLVAVAGGVVGGVLAIVARRRGGGGRGHRLLVGAAVGLGLPTIVFGGILDVGRSSVTRLATEQPELPDEAHVLEVVNIDFTRTGARLVEERWIVVDGGIDAVRTALDGAGWRLAAVPPDADDGWVQLRTNAGRADTLEVGTYGAATSGDADIGGNARHLLDAVPADTDADDTVVHLEPAPGRG